MIRSLAIPTPFAVGRVNCLLVEDDPLTLVDCGPNSATALVELERCLAEHGRRVEDLERIVLTHQHIDHIGLASILAERSGAEVCALDLLAPWLASYSASMEADDAFAERIMRRHGVPSEVGLALRAVSAQFRAWGASVEVTRTLVDGDALAFADRTWTVHHRPGHSPSDTVFHDVERRELIGGDHLIGHISSNPLVSRPLDGPEEPRPHALLTYLDSMRATREMDLEVVLPGHGEPVTDHRALIDQRFAAHEKRAAKILTVLEAGPRSVHEIAQALWGNVAVTQAYLTVSEVLGHLDLLVGRGQVEERVEDELARWAAVAR
ncbi:MBL fold metallo-hydrolase [Conexibacter sp. SYSU D00693]|uniref:MBL fold metallo-hydrolase n=1 Tax=Conexibacter sp. SYSU D00693 TaxID=2812560 RepID=UPI00196BA38D|nr:MBL fold metallo-hydrolase [Conexibacter sp. SYSU D00693]